MRTSDLELYCVGSVWRWP